MPRGCNLQAVRSLFDRVSGTSAHGRCKVPESQLLPLGCTRCNSMPVGVHGNLATQRVHVFLALGGHFGNKFIVAIHESLFMLTRYFRFIEPCRAVFGRTFNVRLRGVWMGHSLFVGFFWSDSAFVRKCFLKLTFVSKIDFRLRISSNVRLICWSFWLGLIGYFLTRRLRVSPGRYFFEFLYCFQQA